MRSRSRIPAPSPVFGVRRGTGAPASCRNRRLLVEPLEDRRLLSVGPELVRDINLLPSAESSSPAKMIEMNGAAYFIASSPTTGDGIWKSDGTVAGTTFLTGGAQRGGYYSSDASQLANVSGTLFFTAYRGDKGIELCRSNGTPAGTALVKDIFSGYSSSWPSNLTNVNGTLFFTANDGTSGVELWKSDGTAAGTVMVKDIFPGASSGYYGGSHPHSSNPRNLTNVNGTLFFTADDGANGVELWKSDGTAAGTVLVKDIVADGDSSSPAGLTNVNGTLFFAADDGTYGRELWKSNGTEAGTVLVKDIFSGNESGSYGYSGPPNNSDPQNLTSVKGTLFFTANDGTSGVELWKSDGTGSGTVLVKDIFPGTSEPSYGSPYPNSSSPQGLTNVNGTLF